MYIRLSESYLRAEMRDHEILERIRCILDSRPNHLELLCSHGNGKRSADDDDTSEAGGARKRQDTGGEKEKALLEQIAKLQAENDRMASTLDKIKELTQCSVCLEISEEDVLLKCGHHFCKPCLTNWRDTQRSNGRKCPQCRAPTTPEEQFQHRDFKEIAQAVKYTKIFPGDEKYIGDLHEGKRHGKGWCLYPHPSTEKTYEGDWLNDKPHGKGVLTVVGISTYEGEWRNGEFDGYGRYKAGDMEYVGNFVNGKKHGYGREVHSGTEYEYDGHWKDDVKEGFGKYTSDFFLSSDTDDYEFHYEGMFKNGLVHGRGIMTYKDGEEYDGEWKNGVKSGEFTVKYGNGDVYKGSLEKGKLHGHGVYTFASGDSNEGEWKDGERSGLFVVRYRDGGKYEGPFERDHKHGQGVYTAANGTCSRGEWKDGVKSGEFTVEYHNGDQYKGLFERDKKNGRGVYTLANGTSFEGEWQNGQRSGEFVVRFANGHKYEGNMEKNLRNGYGVYTLANGTCFRGTWKEDIMTGEFTVDYANGDKYEGNFEHNVRSGYGVLTMADGTCYRGDWKDDKWSGHGCIKFPNGEQYEGDFLNDEYHGHGKYSYISGNFYEGSFKDGYKSGRGTRTLANGDKKVEFWHNNKQTPEISTMSPNDFTALWRSMPPGIKNEVLSVRVEGLLKKMNLGAIQNSLPHHPPQEEAQALWGEERRGFILSHYHEYAVNIVSILTSGRQDDELDGLVSDEKNLIASIEKAIRLMSQLSWTAKKLRSWVTQVPEPPYQEVEARIEYYEKNGYPDCRTDNSAKSLEERIYDLFKTCWKPGQAPAQIERIGSELHAET